MSNEARQKEYENIQAKNNPDLVPEVDVIAMDEVESSQINAIGYNPINLVCRVQFAPRKSDGKMSVYDYAMISPEMFAEFQAAESKGSFHGRRIKPNPDLFPYRKVE